jgi:capsular polysaccharide biosynthesis protein
VPALARLLRTAARSRLAAERRARDLRLLPGEPAPAERIDSLAAWLTEEGSRGSRLVELPRVEGPPARAPARTVQVTPHPKLETIQRLPTGRRHLVVAEIAGARLATAAGLVVSPDNRVFAETAWDEEQLRRLLRTGRLPRTRSVRGTHASLVSQWCDNYSHWLLEALPRTAVLDEAGYGEPSLIVPARLSPFQRDSLRMLRIPDERLTRFAPPHLAPDALVWAQPPDHTGLPSAWTARWLRERLVEAAGGPSRRDRRLYVSRRGAPKRRAVNEDDLIRTLAAFDFDVVHPERMSFADQIRLFAQTNALVAPHGAAVTSIVFSERLSVLELFEPSYVIPTFYCLSSAVGHDYWYLMCEPVGGGDYRVPLDLVTQTLERMLAT